jgi:hypothetical protein
MADMQHVTYLFGDKPLLRPGMNQSSSISPFIGYINLILVHVDPVLILIGVFFVYNANHILPEYLFIMIFFSYFISKSINVFQSPKDDKEKGIHGERYVLQQLDNELDKQFSVFNNLLIPNPYSKTGFTEIDVLVVSSKGIFIVEVKNLTGANRSDDFFKDSWTIDYPGSEQSYEIKSPIKQASIQKKVLRSWLKNESTPITTFVMFTHIDFELTLPSNTQKIVCCDNMNDIITQINSSTSYHPDLYSLLEQFSELKKRSSEA